MTSTRPSSALPTLVPAALVLAALLALRPAPAAGQSPAPSAAGAPQASPFAGLHWRLVGPFRAGRSVAATGVPGEPEHFYFGAADGGVWESRDAGTTWEPTWDGPAVASVGAIAVAPSDHDVLWVGTGEADIRSSNAWGDGIYRSDDGGKSWRHLGLDDTRRIGRILVDPRDPDRALVAALG
ncbi:MAG TPA: hypothetical protein VKA44_02905, partial [Gemmatimonadota bacterium]|nr:hypothetical protein [Gemmatimonadota bacterium]